MGSVILEPLAAEFLEPLAAELSASVTAITPSLPTYLYSPTYLPLSLPPPLPPSLPPSLPPPPAPVSLFFAHIWWSEGLDYEHTRKQRILARWLGTRGCPAGADTFHRFGHRTGSYSAGHCTSTLHSGP